MNNQEISKALHMFIGGKHTTKQIWEEFGRRFILIKSMFTGEISIVDIPLSVTKDLKILNYEMPNLNNIMEYKNFEDFLQFKHMEDYTGVDDDAPDAFESWLVDLQADELIEYADEYKLTN